MYPYIYNFEDQKYTVFMDEKPVTIPVSDPRYSQLDEVFDKYSKMSSQLTQQRTIGWLLKH